MLTDFGAQLNASVLNIRTKQLKDLLEVVVWYILHKNPNKDNDGFVVSI